MKNFILISLSAMFLFSCSMEKRLHNKGYHITWKKHYSNEKSEKINAKNEQELAEKETSSEIQHTQFQENLENTFDKTDITTDKTEVIKTSTNNVEKLQTVEVEKKSSREQINTIKNIRVFQKLTHNNSIKKVRMDGDLVINITLTVLFAGACVVFIILALAALAPMIYVWWGLALVAAILFITQVIDLIMW